MTSPHPASPKTRMLREALEKARLLLTQVRRQHLELLDHPPQIPPQRLEQGHAAMHAAARSAQRTVAALEALPGADAPEDATPPTPPTNQREGHTGNRGP